MLSLLVWIVVIALVLSLVWYIVDIIPMPPPIKQVVRILFLVIAVLVVAEALLGFAGHPVLGRW